MKTARQELEKLSDAEQQLQARRDELTVALRAATEAQADAILKSVVAGRKPEASDAKVAGLQADISATDEALALLEERRADAERRATHEDIEAMLAEASQLVHEAAERQKTTDRLLAELLEHEGVVYIPAPPPRNPIRSKTEDMRWRADELRRSTRKMERRLEGQAESEEVDER